MPRGGHGHSSHSGGHSSHASHASHAGSHFGSHIGSHIGSHPGSHFGNHFGNHFGSHYGSHCRGSGGHYYSGGGGGSLPSVPWHYWAKYRGPVGVCVICALGTIGALVDIILACARYHEEIGSLAGIMIELDTLILCLEAVNFASAFKVPWLVCGYYCQMAVTLMGIFVYFPVHLALGLAVERSNVVSSFERMNTASVDLCAVGGIYAFIMLIAMIIWSVSVTGDACRSPDYLEYRQKAFAFLQSEVVVCEAAGIVQQEPAVGAPQPAGTSDQGTAEQIVRLQAEIDELKTRQAPPQDGVVPTPGNIVVSPALPPPGGFQEVQK